MKINPENIKDYERYDRFFRLIEYIVYKWHKYQESVTSNKLEGENNLKTGLVSDAQAKLPQNNFFLRDIPPHALPIIDFEKLLTFLCRFWDHCYRNDDPKGKNREMQHCFNFLQEVPAKHGRRVAKITTHDEEIEVDDNEFEFNKNFRFVNDILYNLQEEKISKYLEINCTGEKKKRKRYEVTDIYTYDAEGSEYYVLPSSPISNSAEHLNGFTDLELKLTETLVNVTKKLSASQIKALGTHENKSKTIKDAKKEFKDILVPKKRKKYGKENISLLNELVKKFEEQNNYFEYAKDIISYLNEVLNKSKGNKIDYAVAYNSSLNELSATPFLEIFKNIQNDPDEMWNDPILGIYFSTADYFIKVIKLIAAAGYYIKNKKLENEFRSYFEIGQKILLENKVEKAEDLFQNGSDSLLKSNIHKFLLDKIIEFQTWVKINSK